MEKTQKNKAITLVALVITVIISIILSAIALNMIFGENGIIHKAKSAKTKYESAQEEEEQGFGLFGNSNASGSGAQTSAVSQLINDFSITNAPLDGFRLTINLTNPITTTNSSNIAGYIIVVNNKAITTEKTLPCNITLEKNTSYTIKVVAIDEDKGLKESSNSLSVTTPDFRSVPLEYPMLTENGVVNCKFVNPSDETDFFYGLDLSVECTGTNALQTPGYDGDESTYVQTGANTRFTYADGYMQGWWCVKTDSGPSYQSTNYNWRGGSSEFVLESNGYYRMNWYGYPGSTVGTGAINTINGGGNLYEIATIIK